MMLDREHPILSPNEIKNLCRAWANGDQNAKEKLALHHIRFIKSIANQYQEFGFDDAFQIGFLTFWQSLDKYDYKKGIALSTYMKPRIKRDIQRYLTNNWQTLRLPEELTLNRKKCFAFIQNFKNEFKREPSYDEIAAGTSLGVKQVENALEIPELSYSLDDPEPPSKEVQKTPTENPIEEFLDVRYLRKVSYYLGVLDPIEKVVIKSYFGIDRHKPLSVDEIAGILGVSVSTVRRKKEDALEKLRKAMRGGK